MSNRKYYELTAQEWDAAVSEIEKKSYSKDEAKALYKEGKLKDGEIISIKGAADANGPVTMFAAFMSGKFVYNYAPSGAINIRSRKRKLVAHLMDQIEQGMIDTRQQSWLPPRLQSPKNPDFVLYGAKSNEDLRTVLGRSDSAHAPEIIEEGYVHEELEKIDVEDVQKN